MRAMYRACFRFAPGSSDVFDDAARACLDWCTLGRPFPRPEGLPESADSLVRTSLADGVVIEAVRADVDDERAWCLRFEHPDAEDGSLRWITELGLLEQAGGTTFACSNLVARNDGAIAPMRRYTSRPRIVKELLDRYGCSEDPALSSLATELTAQPDEIDQFLDTLQSPTRRYPVVFVSATQMHDRPLVDVGRLASLLVGLGYVYAARNRFTSLRLQEVIPRELSCWDGAVRLYWPGFSRSDSPYRHRLWPPAFIRDLLERSPSAFANQVLTSISQIAVSNTHDRFLTWSSAQRRALQASLASAIESDDTQAIVNLYSEENDRLRQEIEQSRADLAVATDDTERLRAEAEQWRKAYTELASSSEVTDRPEDAPVASVKEAIGRAKEEFADRLVFALNSKSNEHHCFAQPSEAEAAFRFLATTYYEAKTGRRSCPNFDEAIRRSIDGWSYSTSSEITATTYRDWYTCAYNGEMVTLRPHIGTGTSKDPSVTIRIAFDWHEATRTVVIGFVGQHQRTAAT